MEYIHSNIQLLGRLKSEDCWKGGGLTLKKTKIVFVTLRVEWPFLSILSMYREQLGTGSHGSLWEVRVTKR